MHAVRAGRIHCVLVIMTAVLLPARSYGDEEPETEVPSARPNVLLIAVDDLASCLGCGDSFSRAHTPHIDRLAESGVYFRRAYCQVPLCNPSRASVLTGLRPDRLTVFDLDRHFREQLPDVVTLPQLFRRNNYLSARVGKLYHYNVPAGIGTDGLDDPPSWDLKWNPKGRDVAEEHLITNPTPERPVSAAMSWLRAEGTDEEQTDGAVAAQAVQFLRQHGHKPFFLGVGFFRPHTPYVAPSRYFDLYPEDSVTLPESADGDRDDIPAAAFAHNCPVPDYGLEKSVCRQALQAYLASVSFVDAQVGRILEALDRLNLRDRTIVVLWSDHGYHLGEHNGIWQKRTLFEESAGAPLVIHAPASVLRRPDSRSTVTESGGVRIRRSVVSQPPDGNGRKCDRIVEFIDIYPTVAELCGLEVPSGMPGRSLVPLLQAPDRRWNGSAFTQILRPGDGSPVMGRTVRTARWRYTDWNRGEAGHELYDHRHDPGEITNQADNPAYQQIVQMLRKRLDDTVSGTVPLTPFNPARL